MNQIRFRLLAGDSAGNAELKGLLSSQPEIEVPEGGAQPGAPMADLVVIALIKAGATVVSKAIGTFGTWLINRKHKGGDDDPTVEIRIRGDAGSFTLVYSAATTEADIQTAMGKVGEVQEVEEGA